MALTAELLEPALRGAPSRTADVLTKKALEFLDVSQDDERPFFLYLAPCE